MQGEDCKGKIVADKIPRSVWHLREYLRKNEFVGKTFLACLSGARMGLIHEIKKCQKISWHCPFKTLWLQYGTSLKP